MSRTNRGIEENEVVAELPAQVTAWLRAHGFQSARLVLTPTKPGIMSRKRRQGIEVAAALVEGLHVATACAPLFFDEKGAPREVGADGIGEIADLLLAAGFSTSTGR